LCTCGAEHFLIFIYIYIYIFRGSGKLEHQIIKNAFDDPYLILKCMDKLPIQWKQRISLPNLVVKSLCQVICLSAELFWERSDEGTIGIITATMFDDAESQGILFYLVDLLLRVAVNVAGPKQIRTLWAEQMGNSARRKHHIFGCVCYIYIIIESVISGLILLFRSRPRRT